MEDDFIYINSIDLDLAYLYVLVISNTFLSSQCIPIPLRHKTASGQRGWNMKTDISRAGFNYRKARQTKLESWNGNLEGEV